MIHLEHDAEIHGSPELRIAAQTGDFEDTALISFYDINTPDVIAGSYQAQFIKYGNLVYQHNDPKSLGEAILAIDPTSTHTAASYVRMTNELLAQMNAGSLESNSLDQVIVTEQSNMAGDMASTTDATSTDALVNDATTTPETTAPVFDASGSTTPQSLSDSAASTTSENATTTPVIETGTTTSTTTPE